MGKVSRKRRSFKIKQKRKRKQKIGRLKKEYREAKSKEKKKEIIKKILRISPQYPVDRIKE